MHPSKRRGSRERAHGYSTGTASSAKSAGTAVNAMARHEGQLTNMGIGCTLNGGGRGQGTQHGAVRGPHLVSVRDTALETAIELLPPAFRGRRDATAGVDGVTSGGEGPGAFGTVPIDSGGAATCGWRHGGVAASHRVLSRRPGWSRDRPRAPYVAPEVVWTFPGRPGRFRDMSRAPWGRGGGVVGCRGEMSPCTGCTAPLRGPSGAQQGPSAPLAQRGSGDRSGGRCLPSGACPS